MTTMQQILNDARTMSLNDLRALNQMVVDRLKDVRLAENLENAKKLKIGQFVAFNHGKRNPRRVIITITRIANGKVYGWENGGYGEWHCPINLVTPV